MPIKFAKVYKMLGASPSPATDILLGIAVNTSGNNYEFVLPNIAEDYQFYYYIEDMATNTAVSVSIPCWYGVDGIRVKTFAGENDTLGTLVGGGGVIKHK